jgi:hypothetical protein
MQITITQKMSFGRPVIGPKHYLSTGASGWIETFLKTDADAALRRLLGRVSIADVVNNFIEHMELEIEKKKANWTDVTKYLSRIVRVAADKVPYEAGVAFWAHVVQIEDQEDKN